MSDDQRIEALAVLVERASNIMRGFALTLPPAKRDELIELASSIDDDLQGLLT